MFEKLPLPVNTPGAKIQNRLEKIDNQVSPTHVPCTKSLNWPDCDWIVAMANKPDTSVVAETKDDGVFF